MKRVIYVVILLALSLQPLNLLAETPSNTTESVEVFENKTALSEDEIRERLSEDLLTAYEIEKDYQESMPGVTNYTLQEFIEIEHLAFFDNGNIWNPTEIPNDYTGIFIGRDLKGIELFSNLAGLELALIGPIDAYNFLPLSEMTATEVDLSLLYEPKQLSDHVMGGLPVRYKYMYDEELEQGLVSFLNEISTHINGQAIPFVMLGYGMSHLPRMYDYTWTKGFFEKGIVVNKMEQHGPDNSYILEYDIVYNETTNKYSITFDFETPYTGVEASGAGFEVVEYFGKVGINDSSYFETLFFYDVDGNEINLLEEDEPWAGFDKIVRFKGSVVLDDIADELYDEQGIPRNDVPYHELPTPFAYLSLYGNYSYDDANGYLTESMLTSNFHWYVDLPLYVELDVNPENLDLESLEIDEQQLHQLVRNNEPLELPIGNIVQDEYTLEGWYADPTFTPESKWDFSADTVHHNAYYNDPYTRDLVVPERTAEKLYAKWVKSSKYTVDFESNGGSPVESEPGLLVGSKVTEPAAPTRDGYTFDGWYKEVSTTNLWEFKTDTISGNTTLYAKWIANQKPPKPEPEPKPEPKPDPKPDENKDNKTALPKTGSNQSLEKAGGALVILSAFLIYLGRKKY